jgi:hypothetical protein
LFPYKVLILDFFLNATLDYVVIVHFGGNSVTNVVHLRFFTSFVDANGVVFGKKILILLLKGFLLLFLWLKKIAWYMFDK